MLLKNKKNGEIAEASVRNFELWVRYEDGRVERYPLLFDYSKFEDYCEEPKEYWYIDCYGMVLRSLYNGNEWDERRKQIGNHFETKEEAKKAVEKLKAWKRLKDKGFRFTGINDDEDSQELITQCGILCEANIYHLAKDEDFLLLFGGEK